jgi:hypothetical protein
MKLELAGQFRGPECHRLIDPLRLLRTRLEPWFASVDSTVATTLAIVLRVDGSLGSFGPPGIENIAISRGVLSCDLVVSDRRWGNLDGDRIFEILSPLVVNAINACLTFAGVVTSADDLQVLLGGG